MISIVVNLDTRPGFLESESKAEVMLKGARSVDFLTDGITNKRKFFEGYDIEVIAFIDYHDPLPSDVMNTLTRMLDVREITTLVFNNHREYFDKHPYYPKFNDLNYLQALAMARGEYIAHFDADVVAFCNTSTIIKEWMDLLDDDIYRYISYPSLFSPKAVDDPAFDYMWASTRFFMCKRKTIKFDETLKCLSDSDYLYDKYGERSRRCPWFEHVISLIEGGHSVRYPPIEYDRCLIFSWNYYKTGTIGRLQNMPYQEVKQFVLDRGGISYPNDVSA